MSAANGSVLTIDHSVSPKGGVDGEYRHAWKPPAAGPRLVAEGTDTVASTGTLGVVLRDLTSLVALGETFIISAALAAGSSGTSIGLEGEGVSAGNPEAVVLGAKVYLTYSDPGAHSVKVACNNYGDNDVIVHWRVHAFPAT